MYLDIDIGNSRSKWRLGEGATAMRGACASTHEELLAIVEVLRKGAGDKPSPIKEVRISSVKDDDFSLELTGQFVKRFSLVVDFAKTRRETIGIRNSYSEPEKMGIDRWCAVIAAVNHNRMSQSPNKLVCIVDAGSALTLDLVSDDGYAGNHLGGFIVPGFAMQLNSLLGGTQRITVDNGMENISVDPGNNTHAAVTSGILASLTSLIESTVNRQQQKHNSEAALYLTGGDAELLQTSLEKPVQYHSELVLDGIGLVLS